MDARNQEACEAALNLIIRAAAVLTEVRVPHRRISEAMSCLAKANAQLEDYLGR